MKKLLNGSPITVLRIFLSICLIVTCFPQAASAGQASSAQEWVTPPVVATRLEQRFFHSPSANTDVSYHIYTPELYDIDKTRRFPVIYWLHGSGGHSARGMPKIVEYFDNAMREGKVPPSLIVFPNGMAESMWCNSKDGRVPMETVLIDELVPQIDASFRTIASRTSRLIEGFSMGGYGAARLGFKYPEIFGAVSIISAGPMQLRFDAATGPKDKTASRIRALHIVYGDDQAYFLAQSPWVMAEKNADAVRERSRVRIAVGNLDSMMGPNQDFSDHLSRLRIPHDYYIAPNVDHNALYVFQALGEANWDFYRAALNE